MSSFGFGDDDALDLSAEAGGMGFGEDPAKEPGVVRCVAPPVACVARPLPPLPAALPPRPGADPLLQLRGRR